MTTPFRSHQNALEELWRQGLSGHKLLLQYTERVDAFIVECFQQATASLKLKGDVTVIALGGYGRSELYPFSDIDLLLLHDRRSKKQIQSLSESVFYPLWDEGLDVGHSVRTVKDALQFANEDFIFQVALLDARLITGSASLFEELKRSYRKKILEGKRSAFVRTMEQFRKDRHDKFGSHAYHLEPNIKEGKGGMRDIQAMLWVAKGVYGLTDLDAIESSAMISAADRQSLESSWNMLTKIRNRLHYLRRRKDDQLIFDYQEEMAGAFGYQEGDGVLAVEHFMRDVYGHLQTVAVVTDLFFEHVQEILGLAEKKGQERQLEKSIVLRSGYVRFAEADLTEHPYLLMRIFLQSGRTGKPLHHLARRSVTSHLHLVDDQFRASKRVGRIFFAILSESKNVFSVLESMHVSGLLPLFIPEFGSIESLAQHDLYHVYTVDRHLLQTVAELHRLREEMGELFDPLPEPHLLYLAALLHDIGKGKQADHSERGAAMIEVVGGRLQLNQEQRATLAFLVRYHLFMPESALRRDLSDQDFIQQTAEMIGDVHRLTMLYLLTIADSRATGPSAWSSWKSSLLSDLYLQVKSCLGARCHEIIDQGESEEQGTAWLREQLGKQLVVHDIAGLDIEALPDDYLLAFTPEKVIQHLQVHQEHFSRLQQQVLLFPSSESTSWSLLVMGRDRTGLLAKLFGVLALHNLSVLGAQIFTWLDNTVVDVLEVASSIGIGFDDHDWRAVERDFNRAINYRLDIGSQLHNKKQPFGMGRSKKVQQLEHKVVIDNDISQNYTIIEVYGGDSPHALYQLTQIVSDFKLSIARAYVATEIEQLIDIFYVTTEGGSKLLDSLALERVRGALHDFAGVEEEELSKAV